MNNDSLYTGFIVIQQETTEDKFEYQGNSPLQKLQKSPRKISPKNSSGATCLCTTSHSVYTMVIVVSLSIPLCLSLSASVTVSVLFVNLSTCLSICIFVCACEPIYYL